MTMGKHDWADLLLDVSNGDAPNLVQEGIDTKHVIFFFPAGAGPKHTPLTGRTDSDQLATNLEIAAQHALAATHTKTGGADPGAFITTHCKLGTGIPAVITTEIERDGQDPFVCHAIYTSTETFNALPDAVKTGVGGCTIEFAPPQTDEFGTVLAKLPELQFSVCTINNIESVPLWKDGESVGRGKTVWRLVRDSDGEAVVAQTFMFRCESTLTTDCLRQLLP